MFFPLCDFLRIFCDTFRGFVYDFWVFRCLFIPVALPLKVYRAWCHRCFSGFLAAAACQWCVFWLIFFLFLFIDLLSRRLQTTLWEGSFWLVLEVQYAFVGIWSPQGVDVLLLFVVHFVLCSCFLNGTAAKIGLNPLGKSSVWWSYGGSSVRGEDPVWTRLSKRQN